MKIEGQPPSELPTSLFLAASVILTVLVALFLAFSDELQTRLPAPIRPTAVVQSNIPEINTPPAASATPIPTNSATSTTGPATTPTATSVSIIAETDCNNAPADWIEVVVSPGDTIYSLSVRYGATIGEITQANCLETTAVFNGMTLYLPQTIPTREPCGPPQWWTTYIVRPGETLFILAQRHGTTVYAIKLANCMVDSRIFAGRSLFLPPLPAPLPTIVLPTNTPAATPTATSTGLPTPTPSATSVVTPSPTSTSAVTPGTPTPTSTPVPSDTPLPTTTASPTLNPTASPSPTTGTAVPTMTPTLPPTNTPTVPAPTNTPVPTATNPPPSTTSPPPASATSPPVSTP